MSNKHPIDELRDMLGLLKDDSQWLYRYGDPISAKNFFKQLTIDDQKRLLCLALIEGDKDTKNVAKYLMLMLDPTLNNLEQLLDQISPEDQAEVKGIPKEVLHEELPGKPPEQGLKIQPHMSPTWHTIRVFISSTFKDMYAERDYLVKAVFPELRERCTKKHLHLIDLDLRWGVTEQEAEHGKLIDIILGEIDNSRPFFIAILGERYGSVIDNISEDTKSVYPWLKKYKDNSYTALEIIHGVLRDPDLAKQSFFYFRNPQFISKVPESKYSIYLAENAEAKSKLTVLKDKILASGRPVMKNYPCSWDDSKEGLGDLDIFGQQVLDDLWAAINEKYPEDALEADPLAIERQIHEAFAEERSALHVGRVNQEKRLTEYVQGNNRRPVIITSESGCGKSAFLANWSKKYITDNPDTFVLTYFIGASPSSTNYHLLLRNICNELKRTFVLKQEIPEDDRKLSETLALFLVSASRVKSHIVLVLDALDQLSQIEGVNSLSWLLDYMPEKTRLVLSSLDGELLDILHRRQAEEIILPPLSVDEQRQIINTILGEWHRKLDEKQIEALLAHSGVDNPLYLRVALEELKLFGKFDLLTQRIKTLSEDIPGLFGQVLERLEEYHGCDLVVEVFSLIGSSRYGLSEAELLELLRRKGEVQFPRVLWVRLALSSKSYLVSRGELIGFFHRQLADAVDKRYLKKDRKHEKLSAYFSNAPIERKLDEYPYQLHRARAWKDLSAALSDLDFFSYALGLNREYEWIWYWRLLEGKFEPSSCYQTAIKAREKKEGKTSALARILYSVGVFLQNMGQYTSSLPFKKRALQIYEKVFGEDHPFVADSLNNLASLYDAQGKYSEAKALYMRALQIYEKVFGKDHSFVADSLNGLASLYDDQGKYSEAESLYMRALQIYEKALGRGHIKVAASLGNLAGLYCKQGRYSDAESLYRRALEIKEKALGSNHPDIAAILNGLAGLYCKQGRYSEAESLFKRTLEIKEKALGSNHPDIAAILNGLAGLYHNQGKYSEAEPLHRRALEIKEKVLGPDHSGVAASLGNLALLYRDQGRYSEAEPLFKRSLEICEKALGKDHIAVAASLGNLALLYRDQDRYSEAEPLFKRSLEISEKVLGPDHSSVATSLNNLSLLYHNQGKYSEAEPLHRRALEIKEKVLGPDHPGVATSLINLAALYRDQDRYSEAEPLFKRSLEICEKALGKDHINVATSVINLAALYRDQNRYSESEPLFKRALQIYEKALGKDHINVAASLDNLAGLYRNQGRYSEAEPLFKRSLEIREKALGKDHTNVATSLGSLALLYRNQGRYSEAEPLFKRSLEICEKVLGKDHIDVAASVINLAALYRDQNRYSEAEPLFKRALQIYEKALGKDHTSVATSLNGLAKLYYAQGKYSDAEPLYRWALAIAEKTLGTYHPNTEIYRENLKSCQAAMC